MSDTFRKADLHVHSAFSFDVPPLKALHPRALFESALGHPDEAQRMDWFALTDHDTMDGWAALMRELPEADRALVIPGVEHTLYDPSIGFTIHVNVYGLDPDLYERLRRETATLEDLLGFCRERGLCCQYNHPTWWERDEMRRGEVDFARVPGVAAHFEVLELNAARTPLQNLITAGLAETLGLPLTASSDTHTGAVGRACTLAAGETADDFLSAIWRGEGRTRLTNLSQSALVEEAHGLIDEFLDGAAPQSTGERETRSQIQARLETAATRVIRSNLVRGHTPTRESLRLLLKQASRPIMRWVMLYENRLDRRLAASILSDYAAYAKSRAA